MGDLNGLYDSINFTVEKVRDGKLLSFLDILIKCADGTLAQAVYWKETHMDMYLNKWSHHHPAEMWDVMLMLLERVHRIADEEHLEEEWRHLQQVFLRKGYSWQDIKWPFGSYDLKRKEEVSY